MQIFDWLKKRKLTEQEIAERKFKLIQKKLQKERERNAKTALNAMQKLEERTLQMNNRLMNFQKEINERREADAAKAIKTMELTTKKAVIAVRKLKAYNFIN